ncbi:hypothetical protein [Pilimelia columellifera]|uniref:NADH dehydrogenase subunit 6 n=1 Tax=Pilimelia columellifera subsp. columellifera TaxID=706583 RepID=A0ABP6AQF1_9ACTN
MKYLLWFVFLLAAGAVGWGGMWLVGQRKVGFWAMPVAGLLSLSILWGGWAIIRQL